MRIRRGAQAAEELWACGKPQSSQIAEWCWLEHSWVVVALVAIWERISVRLRTCARTPSWTKLHVRAEGLEASVLLWWARTNSSRYADGSLLGTRNGSKSLTLP